MLDLFLCLGNEQFTTVDFDFMESLNGCLSFFVLLVVDKSKSSALSTDTTAEVTLPN